MKINSEKTGCLSVEELNNKGSYPSEERFKKGPIAVIECIQEIPCNPCEIDCKRGAIKVGDPITNLPCLKEDLCTGCGLCIAGCPGLAIFVVDKTLSRDSGTVTFPYEYLPLPQKGEEVEAVGRSGTVVCSAKIIKVLTNKDLDRTPVITIELPKNMVDEARGIKRLKLKKE